MHWTQLPGIPVNLSACSNYIKEGIYTIDFHLVVEMPEMKEMRLVPSARTLQRHGEHAQFPQHSSPMHQETFGASLSVARSSSWKGVLNCFVFFTIIFLAL